MQCCIEILRCSAVLSSIETVKFSRVQGSVVLKQFSAMQCSVVQCSVVSDKIQCSTVQCSIEIATALQSKLFPPSCHYHRV